ncbi:hypothetical protein AB0N09_40770 [Streptomyces erythrochromogenes]|uniref:hypothetical protein n=1 Tax=Streptomyces erythrochromogenes TaxID=285574 RepID=UPI003415964C
MSHEMTHLFGVSHCDKRLDQGRDPICRTQDTTPRCDDILAIAVLDCTKDEFTYFSPRPEPGSALAQRPNENVANSPYLITDSPASAVDVRLIGTRTGECLGVSTDQTAVHQTCDDSASVWRRGTIAAPDSGCSYPATPPNPVCPYKRRPVEPPLSSVSHRPGPHHDQALMQR